MIRLSSGCLAANDTNRRIPSANAVASAGALIPVGLPGMTPSNRGATPGGQSCRRAGRPGAGALPTVCDVRDAAATLAQQRTAGTDPLGFGVDALGRSRHAGEVMIDVTERWRTERFTAAIYDAGAKHA